MCKQIGVAGARIMEMRVVRLVVRAVGGATFSKRLGARGGFMFEVMRAPPQAESGSGAWGNAPVDRIDNYIHVFVLQNVCRVVCRRRVCCDWGGRGERGRTRLAGGSPLFCWLVWVWLLGRRKGRCLWWMRSMSLGETGSPPPSSGPVRSWGSLACGNAFGAGRRACSVAGRVRVCGQPPWVRFGSKQGT